MRVVSAVLLGLLLAFAAAYFFVRKQHRDAILEDGHRASVALAAAGEEVQFKWEYESCPPGDSGVYTEWTRRLVDAKTASSRAAEAFGASDPDAQLLTVAISNQVMLLEERRIKCLKRQGEALDHMAGRRPR